MYGIHEPKPDWHALAQGPAPFGRQCLTARRLVERGVRFVQIYSGGGGAGGQNTWDGHHGIEENLKLHCPEVDRPIAALLTDLERRGLLEETLVVWGGEFGRMPVSETFNTGGKPGGRDHNPKGFTYWLAGGGVKAGTSYGETDELGEGAAVHPHHLRDLHATHPAPHGARSPAVDLFLRWIEPQTHRGRRCRGHSRHRGVMGDAGWGRTFAPGGVH
jgi:arylsulfatase A-like enzyme